ncbi:hypothetical protein DL96DRAFT_1628440 [Flagelloscypha sp. PMI_526]|nr:hypothetical protein DL96DRAFT_1628440 [Flagelloscypha sp. PMI_526]
MPLFGDLPLDLARQICTTAALGDQSLATGRALSSASRVIQEWCVPCLLPSPLFKSYDCCRVDPFIFRHLKFHASSVKNYLVLQTADHISRRFIEIRPFVWSLHFAMDCILDFSQLEQLVSLHPSIKTLYIYNALPVGAKNLNLPLLTHLSASFLSYDSGDFSGSLFARVTHLDISNLDISDLPDAAAGLSRLPLVEAIVIGGEVPALQEIVSILPSLASHIKVIICYMNVSSVADFVELGELADDLATGNIDGRVVVCISDVEEEELLPKHIIIGDHLNKSNHLWDWTVPAEGTFWAQAKVILEERRYQGMES